MLVLVTAARIIGQDSTGTEISEENIDEILDETLDEITTYIQIKDKIGKYYGTPHNYKIKKIAILISPLISQNINMSEMTVKISNNENVKIINFIGISDKIGSNNLFDHPIWDQINENYFGIITTHDKDNSIINYNTINSNTDMLYLIIKLNGSFSMSNGDINIITLFPSTGIQKTIIIEAPLPMRKIVSL